MITFRNFVAALPIVEKIINPSPKMQGYDIDHIKNPHHETILAHGYKYSHSSLVTHGTDDTRTQHSYAHKNDKDHVVGVYPKTSGSGGSHMWSVHKLGNTIHVKGEDDDDLDLHLRANPVRKKAKKK
jgi:hypothetical protein